MEFILFTKTVWDEPPRIRHQVAHMLNRRGHQVTFFERCSRFGSPRQSYTADGIRVLRHPELLHHQLRPFRFLAEMNARYELAQIQRIVDPDVDTVILNFCYDYFFLRAIFTDSPIISIINDDFVQAAKWHMKRATVDALLRTTRMSDHNLVVSYPLLSQVRAFTPDVSLFLHWTRHAYIRPNPETERDGTLYWGYINRRLDWAALRFLLDAGVRIFFVGPMTGGQEVHNLLQHPNASYYGIGDLDAFPQVLAQCACSILPYDLRLKTDVTIGNRSFHLLSYGLPLLFAKMPGLIEAPDEVIHPCLTPSDYLKAYQLAKEQFYTSQDSIARFLNGHSEQNRYQQLMEHVERVRKTRTAQRMRH